MSQRPALFVPAPLPYHLEPLPPSNKLERESDTDTDLPRVIIIDMDCPEEDSP